MLKRSIEDVGKDLIDLAAQQRSVNIDDQNMLKKRKIHAAPMTQYTDTVDSESLGEEKLPSGFLMKVQLRNFMCHENFELELGPKLNFIVGNNGSGKSAILTAITIGLGAKASETNRGSSLKDLIREGCNSAKIVLHLDNSHYGSYNHDEFGDVIIIERTIKATAAASFSLKTASGKEVSNKKKDVLAVVDYFAIPVNNPMCFLSQDAARSFLTASRPEDKYRHFMKGTLLQDIMDNLAKAKHIGSSAQENMILHMENLKMLKNDYKEARKLVKDLNQTSDMNERKRLLQGKSLWIDIKHNNNACDDLRKQIEIYQSNNHEIETKIQRRQEKIDRYRTDDDNFEKEIESMVNKINEFDQYHQTVRQELRDIKILFDLEQQNKTEVLKNSEDCKNKIRLLDGKIERLEQEIQRQMGGDKEQMKVDIEKLEAKNEELIKQLDNYSIQIREAENEESKFIHDHNAEVRTLEQSIQKRTMEMRSMKQGDNNLISSFGRNVGALLNLIKQNEKSFKVAPVGPIGMYMTIKEEYSGWARSIQTLLSQTLNSFVVSCEEDSRLLFKLMRRANVKNFPVIRHKMKTVDYSKGASHCQYKTVVDAIQFSKSELVYVLIDMNQIEKVLLIENKDIARSFLKSKPPNVSMAISIRNQRSGYQISSNGFRLDSVMYSDKLRMKVGSGSGTNLSFFQQTIAQETQELSQIKEKYVNVIGEVRENIKIIRRDTNKVRDEMENNTRNITRLRLNLEKVLDTGMLTSAMNEKETLEQAILGYDGAMKELEAKIEEIAQKAQPIKLKYESSKTKLIEAQERMEQIREDGNRRRTKITNYENDIKILNEKKVEFLEAIKMVEENIRVLQDGIDNQIASATEFCPKERLSEVDLPENQEDIKFELEKISRSIKRAERELGLPQAKVIELYETSRAKLKEGQEKYLAIDKALAILQNSITSRWQNLVNLQKHTCLEAAWDFTKTLRIRNFSGKLLFIKDEKKLDIYIKTTNDQEAREVSSFSGGEKSFSQMALLLATWKPMRSRIIALDEFDVFMDQVNRKIGTAVIVKKLKDDQRTQTIIITPQDITKITDIDSSGVKIHKIRDPQRHNNSNFYSPS